jgi:hypothetical protein
VNNYDDDGWPVAIPVRVKLRCPTCHVTVGDVLDDAMLHILGDSDFTAGRGLSFRECSVDPAWPQLKCACQPEPRYATPRESHRWILEARRTHKRKTLVVRPNEKLGKMRAAFTWSTHSPMSSRPVGISRTAVATPCPSSSIPKMRRPPPAFANIARS